MPHFQRALGQIAPVSEKLGEHIATAMLPTLLVAMWALVHNAVMFAPPGNTKKRSRNSEDKSRKYGEVVPNFFLSLVPMLKDKDKGPDWLLRVVMEVYNLNAGAPNDVIKFQKLAREMVTGVCTSFEQLPHWNNCWHRQYKCAESISSWLKEEVGLTLTWNFLGYPPLAVPGSWQPVVPAPKYPTYTDGIGYPIDAATLLPQLPPSTANTVQFSIVAGAGHITPHEQNQLTFFLGLITALLTRENDASRDETKELLTTFLSLHFDLSGYWTTWCNKATEETKLKNTKIVDTIAKTAPFHPYCVIVVWLCARRWMFPVTRQRAAEAPSLQNIMYLCWNQLKQAYEMVKGNLCPARQWTRIWFAQVVRAAFSNEADRGVCMARLVKVSQETQTARKEMVQNSAREWISTELRMMNTDFTFLGENIFAKILQAPVLRPHVHQAPVLQVPPVPAVGNCAQCCSKDEENSQLRKKVRQLKAEIQCLKAELSARPILPMAMDGEYDFGWPWKEDEEEDEEE